MVSINKQCTNKGVGVNHAQVSLRFGNASTLIIGQKSALVYHGFGYIKTKITGTYII